MARVLDGAGVLGGSNADRAFAPGGVDGAVRATGGASGLGLVLGGGRNADGTFADGCDDGASRGLGCAGRVGGFALGGGSDAR